jgi:hypothetical protein
MSDIVITLRALSGGLVPAVEEKAMRDAANEIERIRAERDEARRDAERWQADALRLIKERNAAMEERDEARREVCYASTLPPRECAEERGWDCWDRKDFCDKL